MAATERGHGRPLVLATRGSALALAQAGWAADRLAAAGHEVEIRTVATLPDRRPETSLAELGDKALWVLDLELALAAGTADLAVHSAKDVPTELAEGLVLAAFSPREDARDAYVGAVDADGEIPRGALVGTSSPRRRALLAADRPDLRLAELRGNVDTRLGKVARGDVDGAVLAVAGLARLGREDRIALVLDPERMVPAGGQGALAIECRSGDEATLAAVRVLADAQSEACVLAERACLRALEGGCRVPVGAHATVLGAGGDLRLVAFDGRSGRRAMRSGPRADPEGLGAALAAELRAADGA